MEGRLLLDVVVREGAAVLVNAPDELKPCLPARIPKRSIKITACHLIRGRVANWRWHEMAGMVGPHFSIRLGENLGLIHVHTALLHARSRVGAYEEGRQTVPAAAVAFFFLYFLIPSDAAYVLGFISPSLSVHAAYG